MNLTGDYHTHSQYSHGKGDLRRNIEVALKKGLKELAITDHGPRTFNLIRLGVKNADQLLVIKEQLLKIQAEYPAIKLLAGVEANIINQRGDLDVPASLLKRLDVKAAGFHLLILPPDLESARRLIFDNRITYRFFPARREEIRKWNTEAVTNAVRRYQLDFITHPGYGVDIDTLALAQACVEADTMLEINSRYGRRTEEFVRLAKETEVNFILNSDAHDPEQVGELANGLALVNELGIVPERVYNLKMEKERW